MAAPAYVKFQPLIKRNRVSFYMRNEKLLGVVIDSDYKKATVQIDGSNKTITALCMNFLPCSSPLPEFRACAADDILSVKKITSLNGSSVLYRFSLYGKPTISLTDNGSCIPHINHLPGSHAGDFNYIYDLVVDWISSHFNFSNIETDVIRETTLDFQFLYLRVFANWSNDFSWRGSSPNIMLGDYVRHLLSKTK